MRHRLLATSSQQAANVQCERLFAEKLREIVRAHVRAERAQAIDNDGDLGDQMPRFVVEPLGRKIRKLGEQKFHADRLESHSRPRIRYSATTARSLATPLCVPK